MTAESDRARRMERRQADNTRRTTQRQARERTAAQRKKT